MKSTLSQVKKCLKNGIAMNLIAVIILLYASILSSSPSNEFVCSNNTKIEPNPYSFNIPFLANHLLNYFDEFEPVDPKYYNGFHPPMNLSTIPIMGLHIDESYCNKHRAHFITNPRFIFEEANAMFDYYPKHTFRNKTVAGILNDLQPNVSAKADKARIRLSWIDPRQQYFSTINSIHAFLHLGKNFGCLTQASNHIPGNGYINRKDLLSESITRYGKKYLDKPQCFSYEKRFPKTWVMYLKDQCEDFFANLMSEKHNELKAANGVVYIRKIGIGTHNALGVFPMDDEEENRIKNLYDNGKNCGNEKNNTVIQYFIPRPLLLFNRKFHFRIYMFIASVNPLMVYYHDGYAKLSLNEYDPNSNDKLSLISNVLIDKNNKGALYHGMNLTELQYFSRFGLDVFQKHLLEQGIVTDPHFVENHLKPEFKKTMIHLVRMTQDNLLKRSQIFELFGVDFIMDQDLNLWFIECNTSPSLEPTYPETEIFIKNLVKDQYEIVMGLTRSRAKRVIRFINDLTRKGEIKMDLEGNLVGLEELKEDFKAITQNQFEPEFLPSSSNNFELIIDEHLKGSERYMGLIPDECIAENIINV